MTILDKNAESTNQDSKQYSTLTKGVLPTLFTIKGFYCRWKGDSKQYHHTVYLGVYQLNANLHMIALGNRRACLHV